MARGAPEDLIPLRPRILSVAFVIAGFLGEANTGAEEGAPSPDAAARVNDEIHDLVRRREGTVAARYSYPERLSLSAGVLSHLQPRGYECTTACDFRGLFLQADVGTGGGSIGLGWASLVGERSVGKHLVRNVYVGYSVKGAILRTWGAAPLDPPGQTFAGIRTDFTISIACFRFGLFRRISETPDAPQWLISGGIGWGF